MSERKSVTREDTNCSSDLMARVDSAKESRTVYFDYTKKIDRKYRNAALSVGRQVGFGVPPDEDTRQSFDYDEDLDEQSVDGNPDPYIVAATA